MNFTKLQHQIVEHLEGGRYDDAIALCQHCINLNPNCIFSYWYLGLAWLLQGEESEAQAIWLSAITQENPEEMDESMAQLLQVLETEAIRYLNSRKFQLAEKIYWQILELDSNQAEAYYNLANALAQQGNFDQAINCWQQSIEIQPDWADAYQNQGVVFQKLEDFESAIACYLKALELKPHYSIAYNLGLCFFRQGRLDDAIACFTKTIQLKPDYTPASGDLGIALLYQGNLDEATLCLNKAIPTSFVESYLSWAETLNSQDITDELIQANADLLKALYFHPLSFNAYFYLGKKLEKRKIFKIAIATYQKAIQIQPDSAQAYLQLGNCLEKIGNIDAAKAAFQQAIQIQPESAEIHLGLSKDIPRKGDLDEAIAAQQVLSEPPKEFYELTWDWAVKNNLKTSHYINIDSKNTIDLIPPRTPDQTIHFSFRFGNQVELPATFVAIIPDGRYWLNKNQDQSAVITSDHKFLADLSPDFPVLSPGHPDKHPSKHAILSLDKLPPIQKIDGTVAVLAGLLNDIYFHWMFDILPRIELLQQSGIDLTGIDKFLVSKHLPYQKETLQALGIAETKILETENYPHIQATRLIVPSFPGTIAWMSKKACDFLRSTFLDEKAIAASEKIDRLYISRNHSGNRRIINEDELIGLLTNFGFKSVTLESMSVTEQAALLANAKVIVSTHGSGLTNTVFCNLGTKVIEIFSPNYVYPCYWLISNLIGLEYYYLLGEYPEGFCFHQLLYPNARIEDIFVNLNELLNLLKFAEVI
jgi:tetratricopeptide (TPR) repeat protein